MSLSAATQPAAPWSAFHRRWPRLAPPLRPHETVCATMRELIAGRTSRLLLLGVTPELIALGERVIAIDRSESALERIWPGLAPERRAINADWRSLPLASHSCSAVVGDGSLNCLDYPFGYRRIFAELGRTLQPGGRLVVRVYVTPIGGPSLDQVRERAMAGEVGNIHALKWMLAMAICAERGNPNVEVQSILGAFNREFPDRSALARASRWSMEDIDHIDVYQGLPDVFSFPTEAELLSVVPVDMIGPRLFPSGTYDLAERCPILVIDTPA